MSKIQILTKDILSVLKHKGYKFTTNMLNDRVEANGKPLTDAEMAIIRNICRDQGFGNMKQVEDAVLADAKEHEYHPVKDYFHGLMGWDGTPYISRLAGYIDDEDGIFQLLLEKFLIGSVAKIFTSGLHQNPMLVLDGVQDLGKSYLARWFLPPPMVRDYYAESEINPNLKDHRFRLAAVWLWEVQELGATTRKADREALKSFLTMTQIVDRRHYGRFPAVYPAMASFIGTINNEGGFLNDPTGHRRFRPCRLISINWDYAKDIYQDDIWAEAFSRYLMGETSDLTMQQKVLLLPVQTRYEVIDPMVEMLRHYFELSPGATDNWMGTQEILEHLEVQANLKSGRESKVNATSLSSAATKIGLIKKKQKSENRWGYCGMKPAFPKSTGTMPMPGIIP